MRFTKCSAPVTSSDRNDGELCEDDGPTDGRGNFLGALDTETDVSFRITNGNECFEAGALTGTGLLLDGHDFHDLVLEFGKEKVDDLILFDGKGEEVDFFHGLDFTVLHETAQLGDGDPDMAMVNEAKIEDEGKVRTIPFLRPCGLHGGDPCVHDRDLPFHDQILHVLVQRQPYLMLKWNLGRSQHKVIQRYDWPSIGEEVENVAPEESTRL